MAIHRRSIIAREGWPYLVVAGSAGIFVWTVWGWPWASPLALAFVALYFLFRDPWREVPPEPLGAVAPVDGRIGEVAPYRDPSLPGVWVRVCIDASRLGAYTVRAPIEGAIHDVADHVMTGDPALAPGGMWLRSEEQHDVILMFPHGHPALGPKAFVRYGERVGQGQRCAYLRLAPRADVYLPALSRVRVATGDRVVAGETILADLPAQGSGGAPA
ncbi:MAG: hypothetical protein ACE5G3_02835 [Gammaproteobacteria bacterium]